MLERWNKLRQTGFEISVIQLHGHVKKADVYVNLEFGTREDF